MTGKSLQLSALVLASSVAMATSPAWAQEPLAPTGPISYWKFDEASGGTTAANAVTGGPAAMYQGSVSVSNVVPPAISYPDPHSLSMNGSNAVLNVPNFGTFTLMSVSAWVQRSGTTNTRQSIVSYKEGNGVNCGFVLSLNEDGSNEYPRIWVQVNGSWLFAESAVAVPTGSWTHLVGTYDGTSITLYVNGTQAAQTGAAGSMTNSGSQTTGIGARASLDQNWFPGLIDDVRIYERGITPTEVAVLAAGTPVPQNLKATPGSGQVSLSWSPPAGPAASYTYNVKRGTASGGETTIAMGVSGTTYLDTGATNGTLYYYVVSAVSCAESGNSNEVNCRPTPIQISPSSLMVGEVGGTATVTVTLIAPFQPGEQVTVPFSTSDTTAGLVSVGAQLPASSSSLVFTSPTSLTFTVTGVSDNIAADPKAFTINFGTVTSSTSDPQYAGINYLPSVACNQIEGDNPGVIVNLPPGGLSTLNGGPQVTFTVQLATIPSGNVSIPLSVTLPYEATVSGPGGLTSVSFTGGPSSNWNQPQLVTITPQSVNTQTTYVTSYEIQLTPVSSSDMNYDGIPVAPVPVFEATSVPPLPKTWGSCGLLGLEGAVFLLFAGWNRRRRRT